MIYNKDPENMANFSSDGRGTLYGLNNLQRNSENWNAYKFPFIFL